MPKLQKIVQAVALSSLLWGSLASVAFYGVMDAGYLDHPLAQRCLAGHWTAIVCLTMFFIGLAALLLKSIGLVGEFEALNGNMFEAIPPEGQSVADCAQLLERLEKLPAGWRHTYLVARL